MHQDVDINLVGYLSRAYRDSYLFLLQQHCSALPSDDYETNDAPLQDPGLLALNAAAGNFSAVPAKLAEKRKLIEEIAHNDVKKVSPSLFQLILR